MHISVSKPCLNKLMIKVGQELYVKAYIFF